MQFIILMIFHVLVSVALIALILVQRGKGSEMGAAFGAGASGTMFGSQGSTPFMVKLIAGLAVIFFCTSLGLNYVASKANTRQPDILDLSSPGSTTPTQTNPGKVTKEQPLNKESQQGL